MKNILFLLLILFSFLSCNSNKDEKEPLPPRIYKSIIGNTYIRHQLSLLSKYHIYTFNEDGTIDIEIRIKSEDGELESFGKGIYEYNHPVLKLIGEIGCTNCSNKFEAEVSEDRRKIKIVIWIDELWVYNIYDYYYRGYK